MGPELQALGQEVPVQLRDAVLEAAALDAQIEV
jgi:hypothetical protein